MFNWTNNKIINFVLSAKPYQIKKTNLKHEFQLVLTNMVARGAEPEICEGQLQITAQEVL